MNLWSKSLRGAAIWDEVKDRLKKERPGTVRGQQQRLCIARALAVEPEGAADGRTHQRPGPLFPPLKIEELAMQLKRAVHYCYRDLQHAAGMVRISDRTAFFLLGS